MTNQLDPAVAKIIADFDAYARKRAATLMTPTEGSPLYSMRESAFCLGYKAAVVELNAVTAVFAAACAWRDSARIPDALAGEVPDDPEARLIAAIDAARGAAKD